MIPCFGLWFAGAACYIFGMTKLILAFLISAFAAARPVAPAAPQISPDPALIDPRINPCDDFYTYACGAWLQKTVIPSDHPEWDRGFTEISERNTDLIRNILEGYAKKGKDAANPYAAKLGKFYSACMADAKDKSARAFLKSQLAKISRGQREDLATQLAWLHLRGVSALFAIGAMQDYKHPQNMIAEVDQSGLGLPSREYYLDTSPQAVTLREIYLKYLAQLFKATGSSVRIARREAQAVLHLETRLAEASLTPTQMRDTPATYHKFANLKELVPSFAWPAYYQGMDMTSVPGDFNVSAPAYMKIVNELLFDAPLATLHSYLKIKLIEASARALPGPIQDAFYGFYFKTLYGMAKLPPQWHRCADATEEFMPFALGRSFIAATFKSQSKAEAERLIQNLEVEMGRLIDGAGWMDEATKAKARAKLARVVNQIGFPRQWRSYDQLKVGGSYLQNRLEALAFENRYDLAKIGKPVDREDWFFAPSTVNAGYDAQLNRMQFPAGILQSPMFSAGFDAAANYGAIGAIMGHEISHAFDDQGSQFDADGAMVNWWSPSAQAEFARRGQCLQTQYDRFPTVDLGHVNGALTLGEDIADLGGLKLAFKSWQATLPEDVKANAETLNRERKRFFMAFAQAYCGKDTDAFEKMRVVTDPHPPNRYRVRGALMNLPEFAETFQCKAGDEMAPKQRCEIW